MDHLLRSRFLSHLACLEPPSRELVITYLQTLHARDYSPDTLYVVAGAIKKFVQLMPASRLPFVRTTHRTSVKELYQALRCNRRSLLTDDRC